MESENLLIILKEHCLFKKYKEILFALLENNEIKLFFNKQLKLYDKKLLDSAVTYKRIYNSNKDYTALDFPMFNYEESQIFVLNSDINIRINFSISNESIDLESYNSVKHYTKSKFIFSIEDKDNKKIERFTLNFSQYIIKNYQSIMLVPEFINSKKESYDTVIEIFFIDNNINSIRLKNFILISNKDNPNKREYNILEPNLNILSDQDYNDVIIYGGLTKDKVDIMMLMHDNDSSYFKDYIKNYDKTFFDFIANKPTN